MNKAAQDDQYGKQSPPEKSTRHGPPPDSNWGRPVQARNFRKSISTPDGANPPLAEFAHRCIVKRHLCIKPPNLPFARTQPHAEFRLLSRHDTRIEPSDLLERLNSHQRISTAGPRLPDRSIPFKIAKLIVDRIG